MPVLILCRSFPAGSEDLNLLVCVLLSCVLLLPSLAPSLESGGDEHLLLPGYAGGGGGVPP